MSFSTWIPIIMMVLTFALNIPVTYGMVAAGAFYLLYTSADLGIVVGQVMGTMYTGYVLMAIPLFIFTANVMNSGKVTDAMFDFSKAAVGKKRGALAYVNVLISLIFSGMTGSAIADAAGMGLMEIKAMEKDGYDLPFSCAITAATATIGPIFPPSIPFVIYAMLSGTSVGALFLGGVVPAILIAVALSLYIAYVSQKRKYPEGIKFSPREFWRFTLRALPALLTPVILLAGIYTGVMTPTEAGAIAALYALIISVFVYRILGWKEFQQTVKDTAFSTGSITILTAAAAVFSYIVAKEKIPDMVSDFMLGITDNKIVLLLIINALFLVLGMFLDTAVLQYVFLPMVIPIVRVLGIDMVHFGVLICLNMMIGLSTPPFGFLLFVTANIAKTSLSAVVREVLPMVGVLLVVLMLLTFVPQLVLFVPSLMG
ncbi:MULTISPECIES: TRAP transporter large permease [Anaerotruncus]|jgi:tripartite ATP-independent transporter DctM subunit|nr:MULTISPECIES: TRAP transporter large permease [Anaerotruncus]RGX54946.1 TRAP transporter large permease [Anaerotruncus sp. AF02-27]